MELASVEIRQALLKPAVESKPQLQLEEKIVVDLGDLIERLKIQIDNMLGR